MKGESCLQRQLHSRVLRVSAWRVCASWDEEEWEELASEMVSLGLSFCGGVTAKSG